MRGSAARRLGLLAILGAGACFFDLDAVPRPADGGAGRGGTGGAGGTGGGGGTVDAAPDGPPDGLLPDGPRCAPPGGACDSLPCCSSTCLNGTCAGSFGGLFQVGDGLQCPSCQGENYYTAVCACPAGFEAFSDSILTSNDCAGAGSLVPSGFRFCPTANLVPGSVWGGAFQQDDQSICRARNLYTNDCSCPPGYAPGPLLRLFGDGGAFVGFTSVFFCYLQLGQTDGGDSFGGVFAASDGCGTGVPTCIAGNPLAGGGCGCPSGYAFVSYRVFTDCNGGTLGANVAVCSR